MENCSNRDENVPGCGPHSPPICNPRKPPAPDFERKWVFCSTTPLIYILGFSMSELGKCPTCAHGLSSSASRCPKCGETDFRRNIDHGLVQCTACEGSGIGKRGWFSDEPCVCCTGGWILKIERR